MSTSSPTNPTSWAACRAHVLSRIKSVPTGAAPFFHMFIEDIFPADFYETLRDDMLRWKYSEATQDRVNDNPDFVNKRYNLFEVENDMTGCVRSVFESREVKLALIEKFFVTPSRELADALSIHNEFEYVFTKAGRFQNIHIDIPPKYMSFVFYIPEKAVALDEEERNATILYDKQLKPHYLARFKANSVCVFVPHFYSYHGFNSTIDRDALLLFYVNKDDLDRFRTISGKLKNQPPYTGMLDAVEYKLRKWPLIEYQGSEQRILGERAACRINAKQGRVLVD